MTSTPIASGVRSIMRSALLVSLAACVVGACADKGADARMTRAASAPLAVSGAGPQAPGTPT